MHHDVIALRDFYYTTSLGRAAQKALRDQCLLNWADMRGKEVAGFGFAVPLLRPWLAQARRVIALMPAQQGVMHWPAEAANHSVLTEETSWPLATDSIDRLVMLHGLESCDRPAALLEEAARVLRIGGEALFILPNRSGLWARMDSTPFALGRPYSSGQIASLLRDHGFQICDNGGALYFPPRHSARWLRWAMWLERLGQRMVRLRAGGVLIVRARRAEDTPSNGLAIKDKRPLRILDGVAQPAGTRPAWRAGR
ncbi:MAG: methyltransferase domain-containing protein [Alphaproteobacteria bacterium]|nr:methyltransferase domain-containing protein [Alphaproteobacteria bacterium]